MHTTPNVAADAPKTTEASNGDSPAKKLMATITALVPGGPSAWLQFGALGLLAYVIAVVMPDERQRAAQERGAAMQVIGDIHRQHEREAVKTIRALDALTAEIREIRHQRESEAGLPVLPEVPHKGGDDER